MNNCQRIQAQLGDIKDLPDDITFDCIIANINLNILRLNLAHFNHLLNGGGLLFMSGILETDIPLLVSETIQYNITFTHSQTLNNWALISFKKM